MISPETRAWQQVLKRAIKNPSYYIGWAVGREAAATAVRRFQDMFGWRLGENRNGLVRDIEDSVWALIPEKEGPKMTIEQVAMAMWAGQRLALDPDAVLDWVKIWQALPADTRLAWRTPARAYLRALGKIK